MFLCSPSDLNVLKLIALQDKQIKFPNYTLTINEKMKFRGAHLSYHCPSFNLLFSYTFILYWGTQLVEALRYKPESRGFDSRWSHWNFSLE